MSKRCADLLDSKPAPRVVQSASPAGVSSTRQTVRRISKGQPSSSWSRRSTGC